MGLMDRVNAVFLARVNTDNVKYATFPAAGAGVAMVSDAAAAAWAWAAYVQIVAAATIADPSWLCGALVNIAVVETHYGDYAIATGALAAEVDQIVMPFAAGLPGATALTTWIPTQGPHGVPFPVRASGAPRLAGRIRKNTAASAAGFTSKAWVATAVGT